MPEPHRLPDQLRPNLRLVFVGTAASTRSAELGHYYAHPGNRFWRALHEAGITPRRYQPGEFTELIALGIGFTDLSKSGAQGDILVFDEGALKFTYRFGRWRYWNHSHVVKLLRDRARAQRVPPSIVGKVVGSIYRAALDISFRRSGGLLVILHNQRDLRKIVRTGDAIGDVDRNASDQNFDQVVQSHKMQSMPRAIAVEIASLDGAVVLSNSGTVLAYGAVLQPRKAGKLHGSEGSRTKAAIGASNYGLAVKISSDGDITIYYNGREFFRI